MLSEIIHLIVDVVGGLLVGACILRAWMQMRRINGANPVGVVVPCHRVIGADGSLTGYGGGMERKEWLLAHEGASFRKARAA